MASRKPSMEIPAKRAPAALENDRDVRFQAMLRTACVKAAGVGALSALVGAIPGAGVLLRFALGELADIAAVSAIQENSSKTRSRCTSCRCPSRCASR